ncbi:MAG: DUF4268 domain-containing protein [Candidatus Latescibacteria bacterium]|nr:DUF4268 domain-containing protein [bacterium]MBD3425326.1 DUF4268 domain-containing protein [Candidatus Latescibacterota bacterium]
MYKIIRDRNEVEELNQCTFSELGFKEREHFQEWIVKTPSIFGEELLILQKEFSGFSDTRERLDLLALDKQGDLVIIENKLDDSGRDVTWQALKYTSYCSNLSKDDISKIYQDYLDKYNKEQNAEEKLAEFMELEDYDELEINKGSSQRIILAAANFRKEVTSTVLWLLNYKLRIKCFKLTPYSLGDQLFLTVDQIIPTKDAEEYMIGMAEKVQDEIDSKTKLSNRHRIRREFWIRLIDDMNNKSELYSNISPSIYNWISTTAGLRGVGFNFAVSKYYGRAEIYIDRGDYDENKKIFDMLYEQKKEIESDFKGTLTWERLDDKRASRIKTEMETNVFKKENWDEMIKFMTGKMIELERVFRPMIAEIGREF